MTFNDIPDWGGSKYCNKDTTTVSVAIVLQQLRAHG